MNCLDVLPPSYQGTTRSTDGNVVTPHLVKQQRPKREPLVRLAPAELKVLRDAMAAVVTSGTARGARLDAVTIGGKTGTSQNPHGADHAWFVGFAPVNQPKIVIAVMIEFGEHGSHAARIASQIIARYLGITPEGQLQTEG